MFVIRSLFGLMFITLVVSVPSAASAQSKLSEEQVSKMIDMYSAGKRNHERNVQKADAGDAEAQFMVGVGLFDKTVPGLPRDEVTGLRYLRMAADQGHVEAITAIGMAYEKGRAVAQDYAVAKNFYARAMKLGDWRANFLFVRLETEAAPSPIVENFVGIPLPGDNKAIFDWYRQNSGKKSAAIWINLGVAYYSGLGTERNLPFAIIWTAAAARLGDAGARSNAKKMLRDFQLQPVAEATALRDDASEEGDVEEKIAKGHGVYALHDTGGGWTVVLNPKSFNVGYLPTRLLTGESNFNQSATNAGSSHWPARPAAIKGSISCNTSCRNGDCYRTYSDGKKVHFQAKQVWDPINNQFKWDTDGC